MININLKRIFRKKKEIRNSKFNYPLLEDGFSTEDLVEAAKVLVSKKLTMGNKTKEFEKYFAKKVGAKYALMVNSGSSANLLTFFCITNVLRKNKIPKNSECIVPAICWSTTLWPIIQSGLKPVFADVDLKTYCIDYSSLVKKITSKTKVIIVVNVLGNCPDLKKIKILAKKKNICLIEDTCESLGSIYKNNHLGTHGDFGTYSFYYSHQITSGEGGMIVCKSKADYNILKTLRAHGWDREIKRKKVKDFNFINEGFNLRPLDITAAIGLNQLKRLDQMKKGRSYNRDLIISYLKKSEKWNNQFIFFNEQEDLRASWFGLPLLINLKKQINKKKYLTFLNQNYVETRPIISGNFTNQIAVKLHKIKFNKKDLKNSETIDKKGFFIGLPTKKIRIQTVKKLSELLLCIEKF